MQPTPSPAFDDYLSLARNNRSTLQRICFLLVLTILFWYAFQEQLLFQLTRNPIFYQELDPTYWLFMVVGMPSWIDHPAIAVLDLALFATAAGAAIFSSSTLFPLGFAVLHFIWFVLYNGNMGHHYAYLGILFLSLPFAFNQLSFAYMLLFTRFAFCFIYGTAGLWKVVRGNVLYPPQLQQTLVVMNTGQLAEPNGSLRTQLIQWLVAHPQPAHLLWIAMIALELIFLLGFLTLRYDILLLGAYLLFAAGVWYLFDIWNYENLLFLLTLLPLVKWVSVISQNGFKIALQHNSR